MIGRVTLKIARKLQGWCVLAAREEVTRELESCGVDLDIMWPWDIRCARYISIGDHTFIGPEVLMLADKCARIRIGSKVMFGPRVRVIANDHRVDDPSVPIKDAGYVNSGDIVIGDDVWIGTGATILKCVSIGQGSVIGAGSVLTKSVGAYEVWAGNPARKMRSRLDARPASAALRS